MNFSSIPYQPLPATFRIAPLAILIISVLCSECQSGSPKLQDPKRPRVLASVNDTQITAAEAEAAAYQELDHLEFQHEISRLQSEANLTQQRYQILESHLNRIVAERLLEDEALELGVSRDYLLTEEVESKVTKPTNQQVRRFYKARKKRISKPLNEVSQQIRRYLREETRRKAYEAFIVKLKKKHSVDYFLEPPRHKLDSVGHPSSGPETAAVTIVEFSDFECSFCSRIAPTLKRIQQEYGEKVQIVFRQFPLNNIHPLAAKAAQASLCAYEQDRFWEMHDLLFEQPRRLQPDDLKTKAAKLELDMEAFSACLESDEYAGRVKQDLREGAKVGVTATPALFINGQALSGSRPYQEIVPLIEKELHKDSPSQAQ